MSSVVIGKRLPIGFQAAGASLAARIGHAAVWDYGAADDARPDRAAVRIAQPRLTGSRLRAIGCNVGGVSAFGAIDLASGPDGEHCATHGALAHRAKTHGQATRLALAMCLSGGAGALGAAGRAIPGARAAIESCTARRGGGLRRGVEGVE